MRHRMIHLVLCISFLVLALFSFMPSKENLKGSPPHQRFGKTQTVNDYSAILINNVMNYYSNNGDGSYNIFSGRSGFEYPKGTGKSAIFEDGLLWGGKQNGVIKVGGSSYLHGLQAGEIIIPGTPSSLPIADYPMLEEFRVYRVRRDVTPSTVFEDVQDKLYAEVLLINRSQSVTANDLYTAYIRDWNEWPALQGAPFEDKNGNGIYDPAFDIPGVPGADQTLWHVSNDLDGSRTANLYGSDPIGLELQRTVWAYHSTGSLGSIIFVKYKIVNLSGYNIDSMYFSQWSDPDLGNPSDDLVGCDTSASLGYVYNSSNYDTMYAFPPPAAGFDFFQGPIVPGNPEDRAIFNGAYRYGYKNLPMSSFNFFTANDVRFIDPELGSYNGTLQWYNLMKGFVGRTGEEYIDPSTGQPTKFVLSGDPISGNGWIDGIVTGPGDRRIVLTSGPFTMVNGDTQEVVVALMAAQGDDRLSSITALRSTDRVAQKLYNSFFTVVEPNFSSRVTYPNGSQAEIHLIAEGGIPHHDLICLKLYRQDLSLVDSVNLYDDGLHQDGSSGDGVFGNSLIIDRERGALNADAVVFSGTEQYDYEKVLESITTAGAIEILGQTIYSDNLNNDGTVNPGENIRYGFSIVNNSAFELQSLSVVPSPDEFGKTMRIETISTGNTHSMSYDPNNNQSYFSFNVPSGIMDSTFHIIVITSDSLYNVWRDTLSFLIVYPFRAVYGTPVTHTQGEGSWNFSTKIVDRNALTDHEYEILINLKDGFNHFTLNDVTTATMMLDSIPLPDEYAHNIPVTDGFKVMRGDVWGVAGLNRDSTRLISSYEPWFHGIRFTQDEHAAFNGGVTTGYQLGSHPYLGQFASNYNPERSIRVEVRFDAAQPQKAYRLGRTGPSTEYQLQTSTLPAAPSGEPFVDVPFSVWDVTDPSTPRQLTAAWRDQNGNALWDPPVDSDDGLEIVFIYYKTYDPLGRQFTYPDNPDRPGDVINNEATVGAKADIMYGLSLGVIDGHTLSENPGTLRLVPIFGLTTSDRFTFRTEVTPSVPIPTVPSNYSTNVSIRARLAWLPVEEADSYRLQVSKQDPAFHNVIYDDSTLTVEMSPLDETGSSIFHFEYGTQYYWRVNAKNPYGVSQWSPIFSFTTELARVPSAWGQISETGRNATIAVSSSTILQIGKREMRTGDAIGVFFTRDGLRVCAGYGYWHEGENLVITLWGDNDQTELKDGFAEGESFQFIVWDALIGRGFPAEAQFESGGGVFSTDGIYTASSIIGNTNVTAGIPLPPGWNMISSHLNPNDSLITSIFSDITPSMILVKNGKGQVYWPSLSFNSIGTWSFQHGYQIYMTANDTLWFVGDEFVPQSTPLYLKQGWNLSSYLRNAPLGADTALKTIEDKLVIAKNNFGEVYAPSLEINTIGQMRPGQGYQMYLSGNGTLVYPANSGFTPLHIITKQSVLTQQAQPTRFKHSIAPTGSNAILVVLWKGFSDGDEVAVWTGEKNLIGSAVALNGRAVITMWGDNYITESTIEGAKENEVLLLTTWSPKTSRYHSVTGYDITNLLDKEDEITQLHYRQDAFWEISIRDEGGIPTEYSLSQNYPNPFNPVTVIRYGLPAATKVVVEVYNIIGQRVTTLVNEDQAAGYYEVLFDAHRLASGVYICCIRADSYKQAKKMLLLR